jgi:hypothetical protein
MGRGSGSSSAAKSGMILRSLSSETIQSVIGRYNPDHAPAAVDYTGQLAAERATHLQTPLRVDDDDARLIFYPYAPPKWLAQKLGATLPLDLAVDIEGIVPISDQLVRAMRRPFARHAVARRRQMIERMLKERADDIRQQLREGTYVVPDQPIDISQLARQR